MPPEDDAPATVDVPAPSSVRGTGLTAFGFLVGAALLATVPGIPAELRPVDLANDSARAAVASRLVSRPRMTLAEHEKKLEGQVEVPDLKSASPELDAAEERDLHEEANGDDDLRALASLSRAPPAAEAESAPPVDRAAVIARGTRKTVERRAARSREKHKLLQMPGSAIDNPCVEKGADGCVRTALDPFFATLDSIVRGDVDARAGVVMFGNSLIASDHVTDIVREELQGRFGDGGRGFLLVDRLSKVAGRRVRTGHGSEGWVVRSFAQDPPLPTGVRFGFTGALHESSVDGDTTTWGLERGTRARLSWLDTGAGLRLTVDGTEVLRVPKATTTTATTGQAQSIEVRLPAGKDLKLVADKGARVFGVAIEREVPGVIVDSIGVPAASARLYVEATDPSLFVSQVAERSPALVTLMLGGNETRALSYGTITEARMEEKFIALLDRVREAAPHAACLIVTPIDAAKTTTGSDELVTREEIHVVMRLQKRIAAARGCAVFDLFSAMGGVGSLARMRAGGLVSDDLVHPTNRGGDVLGQLFADAVIKSWVDTPPPDDAFVHRRHKEDGGRPRFVGLSFPGEERIVPVVVGPDGLATGEKQPVPLQAFFRRLGELDQGTRARVAIGQFGASHTAGQMLTDRLRQRLGARFGSLGRGFVSVGKASKRLEPSGVFRELTGLVDVADGRDVVMGGALGMSGTKTRLQPGARFRVGFCQGCAASSPSEENGRLQLAWLYTPDMGTADVLVDGVNVATLSHHTRRSESDVQFLSLPVRREKATLEVIARRDARPVHHNEDGDEDGDEDLSPVGPVHLLSVTEEMDRSGVVLDAIGLPGTTGMTPQRWRQDLYAEEVKARHYDLLITAWGTNEAGIASLDEATYRHHFGATLQTLRDASPGADCLIIGASDRFDGKRGVYVQAPNHDLVERVQRDLAAEHGCAFFSLRQAMGGPGSMKQWVKDGLGNPDHVHFTREGYGKLADLFVDDLLSAWAFDQKQQEHEPRAQGGVTVTAGFPRHGDATRSAPEAQER
ncbi:MAG: GDSL-type esterase/lipase family protein [Deltaproteobacteria bacterium]|nr:GDSL-type esterase/lipase family protein [Deltaproteobacteria bacterium]